MEDETMAAFCTCCGEVMTAKSVTCMACGAPAHGMTMKVAKVSATASQKPAAIEELPLSLNESQMRNRMIPGCCAA
jgi:hypothetical protein